MDPLPFTVVTLVPSIPANCFVKSPTGPYSAFTLATAGLLSPTGATGMFSAYYDSTGNGLNYFGETQMIGSIAFGSGAFSGTGLGSVVGTGDPFSLTEKIVITPNGANSLTFSGGATLNPANQSLTQVPEPSALVFLGTGLIGLGAESYRRNRFAKRHPPIATTLK